MRLVAGTSLFIRGIASLSTALAMEPTLWLVFNVGLGILLLAGLWTPVAGTLVAVIELWGLFSRREDPWMHLLLATLGIALALLGPGAWSIDARLFGWKRIDIRDRQGRASPRSNP